MVDTPSLEDELDISAPEDSLPPLDLDDLPESMRQACARAGWTRLMPVQAHALPYLLAGRDMMIQSRTGSGKTGAYLLPLLGRLEPALKKPQALILAPTRELAGQVEREASVLFSDADLRVAAVYGGVGYGRQLEALRQGVQVLVGTPGRVLDHLLRRTLVLDELRVLVFDEADRMLSIGFYPDMKEIQRYLPRRPLLASLFSATYPAHVLNLAGEFLRDPQMLSLSQGQVHVAATQHLFCECRPMDKDRALVRLLETENPASAIIFCNTKANVHYVTGVLQGFGYNADELSADLSQNRREEVLDRLRAGQVRLLVATDVAARGIDIPALSHVFLYEPPEDRESYIHRAGRTGRAGAVGTVISLVDIMEKLELMRIARYYKIELLPLPTPADEDVARVVGQRVTALLEARRRACTGLQIERARRFLNLAAELGSGQDEEQGLLLALLLDAEYQRSLGAPPLPMAGAAPRRAVSARDSQDSGRAGEGRRRKRRSRRGARDSAPESDPGGGLPADSPEVAVELSAPQAPSAPASAEEPGKESGACLQSAEAGREAPKRRRRRRASRRGTQEEGPAGPAPGDAPAPEDIPVHEDRVHPGDADWR
ncbi:MAG: DEAD/DEAH box helicase [Desulfovibrionaceae bacterium]|nr:DEAD/DEAH box helicase [Desulfovibrionaceae bacterium]